MDHAFGDVSKKSSPFPRSPRFSPVLSFETFIVLHFTMAYKILNDQFPVCLDLSLSSLCIPAVYIPDFFSFPATLLHVSKPLYFPFLLLGIPFPIFTRKLLLILQSPVQISSP